MITAALIIIAALNLGAVLSTIGVALAASALVSIGSLFLARTQQDRVLARGRATVDNEAMRAAVQSAQENRPAFVKDVLQTAVSDVAKDLELPDGLVRGVIFNLAADGSARIADELAVNFDGTDAELELLANEMGVGELVRTRAPVVTVFDDLPADAQEPSKRQLINPALRWIIAVPIGTTHGDPLWVLSIDGLVESRSEPQLESAVARLLYYRELLELLLKGLAK